VNFEHAIWVVILGLLLGGMAFSARAESSEMRLQQADMAKRSAKLNYPKLPEEVVEAKSVGPAVGPKVDSGLAQDWALTTIGFFDVFNPLVQPIQGKTKSCSNQVVVAVVDTGIDYTHSELREHLWTNDGETGAWKNPAGPLASCQDISCNGIDDDHDGYVDDVIGWDFVHDVPLPYDTHGHGSHISGIISASASNGVGSSGVCPGVKIMSLKYYDSSGFGYNNLQNTVRAFHYAIRHGANIINYSGGGADPAPAERKAVEAAKAKNILVVAAAGNEGRNNDKLPYFPASYPVDNVVGVASIDRNEDLLPSSNFGEAVTIAAPGLSIMSSLPRGRFGMMSGTSQATAFVTGAAALLLSQAPDISKITYTQLKQWLVAGARPLKPSKDAEDIKAKPTKLVASGILSLPGSLRAQSQSVKSPVLATPEIARKSRH